MSTPLLLTVNAKLLEQSRFERPANHKSLNLARPTMLMVRADWRQAVVSSRNRQPTDPPPSKSSRRIWPLNAPTKRPNAISGQTLTNSLAPEYRGEGVKAKGASIPVQI